MQIFRHEVSVVGQKDFEQVTEAFRAVRQNEVIKGFVGALDGCLCWIETPSASETANA
jgi:hypothetical protein